VLSTPLPEKEILDYIAHRFLRRVNIVLKVIFPAPSFELFRECHPATRYIPGMHIEVKPRAEQLDNSPPNLLSTASFGSFFNLNAVRNSQHPWGYYLRIHSFWLRASRPPAKAADLPLSQPIFDIHGMIFREQFLFLVVM